MKQNHSSNNPAMAMQTTVKSLTFRPAIKLLAFCVCGVVALGFSSAVDAAPMPMKKLKDHVVPAVAAGLKSNGNLAATNSLRLAIGLPLRNTEALSNLMEQLYDPASTNFHRYLTPQEFTERFGPTEQDYAMVANFARVSGLTVVHTHPNRMVLDVQGKVSDIEKALHVQLKTYKHPKENRNFYMPASEPEVAAGLPILYVSGLENYYLPHPKIKPMPQNGNIPKIGGMASPNAGSGPGGSYQGNDFRTAYVPGTTLTGSGQNVGLLQFDGFYPSDIAAYAAQIGLTNVPNLVVVPIDGGVPVPTPIGNGEVSLDIEMVLSMSPGVSNIYVYEAPNPSPWVDILSQMANDNLARQLSSSWGGGPPDPTAEQIFQQMAVQGQSFFNASGDADAFTGFIPFPSDSPNITEVGGTTLTTGGGAAYGSEAVWNWGNEYGAAYDGIGSSGGISPNYSIPSWQTNINMVARQGSSTMRNVPDVAMTGDNVWVIYGSGQGAAFGGTSCAAPLWAGFMALVNQQAAQNNLSPIGFINPTIYRLATNNVTYTNCFHDVVTGDNTWSGSPNLFVATNNYDLCTGLGSPNGTNLINAFTSVVQATNPIVIHITPPPPPYGATLASLNGSNPNGAWQLFVQDDSPQNVGIISNGWILTLTFGSPVGDSANLQLLMNASLPTVTVGNTLTYTLSVTNYGPSTSSNVLVSDTLPLGVSVVGTSYGTGSVIRSGQMLNWTVGTLATNAGTQLQITVEVASTGALFNYAQATASTSDPNTGDNFASVTVNSMVATPPVLGNASINGGSFQFAVSGNSGVTNIIQSSTNLVNWANIYTNVSPFIYTNSNMTGHPQQFYRAVTVP